jgi:hypothetical protein
MKINLIYCHIGNLFPDYFFYGLHQSLILQKKNISIYILTNQKFINDIYTRIFQFNLSNDVLQNITIVPIEILNNSKILDEFKNISSLDDNFRDGFWQHTTSRFIYIYEFISQFKLTNVFHIENDVMVYSDLHDIFNSLTKHKLNNKIISVQDAPQRSICSIVFIPNEFEMFKFLKESIKLLHKNKYLNDMNLMGMYQDKNTFPDSPSHPLAKQLGIFDGACIGQYLGGIDLRNTKLQMQNVYANPTIGFINETSTFKPNTCNFKFDNMNGKWIMEKDNNEYPIHCLHIHSKQLFNFSSKLPIKFDEIITGDRILDLVDVVITTRNIFNFHVYSKTIPDKILIVNNFESINKEKLNEYLLEKAKNGIVKVFCYTHTLLSFFKNILPIINEKLQIILYTHNSDHELSFEYTKYIDNPKIKEMFCQNLNIIHPKVNLLPIGIANCQWEHGNLDIFYTMCIENYIFKKNKNLYVNINEKTYFYRKEVIEKLDKNLIISKNKNYKDYLKELSEHKFSLCVRGNGIDTHRFWESLYLGVIPVVIVNEITKCDNFIQCLEKQGVPFHKVCNISEIATEIFTDELYLNYFSKLLDKFFILNLNHYRR